MAGTLVRSVMLKITADDGDAALKLDAIAAKAEELKALHPDLSPRIDTAEAQAKMAVLRDELKATAAEAGAAGDELGIAGDKAALAGDEAAESAGKTELLGKAWDTAKLALLGVGAGLAYGVVKAAGFEQAILRLHTQAGVATSQLGVLGNGVLKLAGQVGFSPDSLAESLYHVESNFASLGIKAPAALGLVKIAAQGAQVGGADLVDVTNALSAAVASGIPGVQNYSQAMGSLNAIVGAGDMKMQDLAEAMGSGVVAVVKGYGLSLADVGAALDVFGDNNIRGAVAATDLRMAVQSLAVPAAAGKAALASMGLSMTSLGTTMRNQGLLAALEELQAKFKAAGITAKEQGAVITEIFGKKAGVGLAVLMDQMDRLKSKYPAITKGAQDFGQAWNEQSKTPAQQLKDLEAGAQALATQLGESLLPAATRVLGWANSFVSALQRGSPLITGFAGVIGAVLAGIALKKLEDGLEAAVKGVEGVVNGIAGFAGTIERSRRS